MTRLVCLMVLEFVGTHGPWIHLILGTEPKPDSLLTSNELGEEAFQSLADDSLLNLETSNNDHDWYSLS